MARTLISLKLAVLRHREGRSPYATTGTALGILLAVGTVWLATMAGGAPGAVAEVLAVVLALWALGWLLAPVWGAAPVLRPESFALLPLRPRALAAGLLGAALVGVGPAVTLLALMAVVVHGARLGPAGALVGAWAAVGQLLLVVLASLLAGRARGALAASRPGGVVSGVLTAVMLVLSQSGWVVLVALGAVLETGFGSPVTQVLRALPTSWAVLAAGAAGEGRWGEVAGLLAAQLLVVVALFAAWCRAVAATPRRGSGIRGPARSRPWTPPVLAPSLAAVVGRELRGWWREPARLQVLVAAVVFAVLTAAAFLPFGTTVLVPWVAPLAVLMMMVSTTNPYGQDGTGLWLTLTVPGAARADVRGRQLSWLVLAVPLALVLVAVTVALDGSSPAWGWVLAVTGSLLGAGAGTHVYLGVASLVPEPHRAAADRPGADVTGPAFTAFFAALGAPLPALGVLALAGTTPTPWAGALAGLLTGAAWSALLGSAADRRLARTGPELLLTMRAGRTAPAATDTWVLDALPPGRQRALWAWVIVGTIALVPQAVVPAVMKLTDSVAPVWFLALHLPLRWQWPTIGLMVVVAAAAFHVAARLVREARRLARSTPAQIAVPVGSTSGG